MDKIRYLAYDANGRRVSQAVAAASPDQLKQMLWAEGLHIVHIQSHRLRMPNLHESMPTLFRVRRSEVILFTRQLATFVRVGIPILTGLAVLRDQAGSAQMREALGEMITELGTGASLSGAMGKFPRIFSALYVEMIASAEVSGSLDDTLKQLATYLSRDESALRKVRNAMVYPAIVVALAVGVIAVLVGFVLPAFARLFSEFNASLPLPTRILLGAGVFSRDHRFEIFAVLALVVSSMILYASTSRGKEALDVISLKLPALGKVVQFAIIERYLRTLATLARAGVPITQMLDTANRALGNSVYRKGVAAVRDQMLSGEGLATPLANTGLFPQLVIAMMKVGEESGSLDANLEEAADHYAEEVDFRLKQLIAVMEPALIVVVGAMVGFIAIAVIAPMYGLVHELR